MTGRDFGKSGNKASLTSDRDCDKRQSVTE